MEPLYWGKSFSLAHNGAAAASAGLCLVFRLVTIFGKPVLTNMPRRGVVVGVGGVQVTSGDDEEVVPAEAVAGVVERESSNVPGELSAGEEPVARGHRWWVSVGGTVRR
jgi:hypothetical protein